MQPRFSIADVAGRIAAGYALLATLATGLALGLRDGVPWQLESWWLPLGWLEGVGASAGLGVVFGAVVVLGTRVSVGRFPWAQRLHLELRPIAHGLTAWHIAAIAVFSSLGEELLFRGLVQPWIGLLPTSVIFGVCHQVPGPARWVWVTWATLVGLGFGAIYEATGSLVGPLIAHAVINGVNLVFLRDYDPLEPSQD